MLEILDLGSRVFVAKTKALISCAVTCTFAFAYMRGGGGGVPGEAHFALIILLLE